jgi:hypothetical protein
MVIGNNTLDKVTDDLRPHVLIGRGLRQHGALVAAVHHLARGQAGLDRAHLPQQAADGRLGHRVPFGPQGLDHLGLRDTLEEAVVQWRSMHPEIDFRLAVEGGVEGLGERVNITVYRIVQECLNNIVKHAAASMAEVSVSRVDEHGRDSLRVTVRGMDVAAGVPIATKAPAFGPAMSRRHIDTSARLPRGTSKKSS